MADPAAANCNLLGNPLHEEQLEIVRMIGEVYSLNTVIDEARRLIDLNFGEVIASHQAIVDRARSFCEVSVEQRFSTILTSAGLPPRQNLLPDNQRNGRCPWCFGARR